MSLPSLTGKSSRNLSECFWCYKPLQPKDRTKDHFLSKPVWKHHRSGLGKVAHLNDRSPKCISCERCNSRRGTISGLFVELQGLKRKFNQKRMNGFLKAKKKLMPEMLEFRRKIDDYVQDQIVKKLCLREIDEILIFGAWVEHQHVSVRAYYLWEKAGRPHGFHEGFWLEAERQIKHEQYSRSMETD